MLSDNLIGDQIDYSYENFIAKYVEFQGQEFETKNGQVIYPLFLVEKVKFTTKTTININLIQIHDWAGVISHKSWIPMELEEPPASEAVPGVGDSGIVDDWIIEGCTDSSALNYDPYATIDDGSCQASGYLPYDVNNDGNVDVLDVVMVVNAILGNAELDELQMEAIDQNEDNNVDVLDVVALVNVILN